MTEGNVAISWAIVWASQTGCSHDIAKQLMERTKTRMKVPNIKAVVTLPDFKCCDEINSIDDLARFRLVTFVVPSTGD